MTTKFLIIEEGFTAPRPEWLRNRLCDNDLTPGAKILAFDIDDALAGSATIHECTADFIRGAHARQTWTRAEIEGSPLLSSYIELPVSREEQRADDADARRFEG